MYYDIVVSIYDDENDARIDSHLLCSGFETEDKAMEYLNNNEYNEYKYCYDGTYPCVEIEGHNEDGTVTSVIAVD